MMKAHFSWLLSSHILFLFSTIIYIVLVDGQCLNDQRSHLLHLKSNLEFDIEKSTKLVQWNNDEDCCSWRGVGCDASGRVTTLELDNESITAAKDNFTSLFKLQFLEKLNLGFNNHIGIPIPKAIANLTNLVNLNLSFSGFVGQIPIELSNLRKLVSLDLSSYYSTPMKLEKPTLKMLLQNLSNIEELYLDRVDLSAQRSEWSQVIATSLPKLRVLSLRKCHISGPIHISLSSIHNLSVIRLDGNNISTEVLEFFASMPNLRTLSLFDCNLVGQFLVKIFQVPTLQTLDISNNDLLQGSLPPFPKNSSLRTLDLWSCNFSGTIPVAFRDLLQLSYMDLSHNKFSGSLSSAHFKGLKSLETLFLSNNFLSGRLPSSLFKLPALKKIYLSNNQFSGQIDEIPSGLSVSRMQLVDLSSNQFNGSFPKFLFELKELEYLFLSSNSFSDTIQLETFKNLPNLRELDLSYNNLTVELQSYNSSLAKIVSLGLASCKLKTFPEMKNNTKLFHLDLSDNEITGEIPNWIWNLGLDYLNLSLNSFVGLQQPYNISTLYILDLHSNQLKGELPILSSNLDYVDFSKNNFSGPVPLKLYSKYFMSLSDNSLTGSIPNSVCGSLSYFEFLDLSNNALIGSIPSCLVTSGTFEVLNLAGNNLSGSIPDTFPANCSLKTLDIGKNNLQGKLPRTLSNCTMLEVLNLGHNKIDDVFPCMFENLSNLRVLVLRSNKFHGELECFGYNYSWPHLQIIDMASNNFSGVLSSQFFSSLKNILTLDFDQERRRADYLMYSASNFGINYEFKVEVTMKGLEIVLEKILTIFTTINFSNNKFSGKIPESIGDLKALYVLDLSHNEFTGGIPPSMWRLSSLGSLDLSRNQLTREIPLELQDLTFLSYLNLSFNMLTGKIPTESQFQTYTVDSYIGNVGLCGFPLGVSCGDTNDNRSSSMPMLSNKKEINWMYICASLGYTVGLGIFSMFLLFSERWRNKLLFQVDQLLVKVFGPKLREPIRRL